MALTAKLQIIPDERWKARVELAAAYRIAARFNLDDGIWTHFSLQVPGTTDRFLLKPHGLLFSEVTASNLIMVDLAGNMVEGAGHWEPTAFYIHSRIHAAIPEAVCVLHTHMPYATALSNVVDDAMPMFSQTSLRFRERVAYFRAYEGLALDNAAADRIVDAMQGKSVLVMSNHGVTIAGGSVADAVYTMHYFEKACRELALARSMAAGGPLRIVPDEIAAIACRQLLDEQREAAPAHLAAYMRVLDRECPEFRD